MFHGGSTSSGPTEAGLRAFDILRDAVVACQEAGQAPKGDATGLVLVAWSAVHGFATLWVDRALPFQGLEPERLAPEIGRLITRMFSGACGRARLDPASVRAASSLRHEIPANQRPRLIEPWSEAQGGADGRERLQSH